MTTIPRQPETGGRLEAVWTEALAIWSDGGWAMYAIAGLALLMFATGLSVWTRLRSQRQSVDEVTWRGWIERPRDRAGPLGGVLDHALGRDGRQVPIRELARRFREVRAAEQAQLAGDLRVMKACVALAPLIGLLGTVTGMLATFAAMATGAGGDETMQMVTGGIAEALITTETGLIVALPGLFFQFHLARALQRRRVFLLHVESVCMQTLHHHARRAAAARAERAARTRIAQALRRSLGAAG